MNIISLPVEIENNKAIDGKFRLVSIASQRAKELSFGSKPKITTKSRKVTTIAIEEAIEGKLEFLIGEEAVAAMEKAGKLDHRKLLEESRKMAAGEELSEFEKEALSFKVNPYEKETFDKKAFEELFGGKREAEPEESEE